MSATSSVFFKLFIISLCYLLPFCSGSTISHINSNQNNNNGVTEWQRNLESLISRLVGRMDQLELRVGRVQSLVQMRFDNIENGLTTTKLRMDLWGDSQSQFGESLSRKWKILESKFDIMIGSIDSKLESKLNNIDSKLKVEMESKLNAMQRDNRRHNEFLASAFQSVAIGQEKLSEKVSSSMIEVNSSIEDLKNTAKNSTPPTESSISASSSAILVHNSDKMLNILEAFISNTTTSRKPSPVVFPEYQNHSIVQYQYNKVTNMFEDLMTRSTSMETTLKDAIAMTNATRRDVHDGFRTLLHVTTTSHQHPTRNSNGGRSSSLGLSAGSSSEIMSAVIVEALASVESMSTALGRRISDFSRSVDQRLEMVSMSINGFLESCVRIQDNAPLIEDHIADLLMKILDTVENSTRSASDLWYSLAHQISEDRENTTMSRCPTSPYYNEINSSSQTIEEPHLLLPIGISTTDTSTSDSTEPAELPGNEVVMVVPNTGGPGSPGIGGEDSMSISRSETDSQESVLVRQRLHQRKRPLTTSATFSRSATTETFSERTTGDILTEDDKKSLWESLVFPKVPE